LRFIKTLALTEKKNGSKMCLLPFGFANSFPVIQPFTKFHKGFMRKVELKKNFQ
jgi:hypothetical protein